MSSAATLLDPQPTRAIEWPKFFRHDRAVRAYGPLIERARHRIRAEVPSVGLANFLAYQVWDNPQPTYLILPFMFLASAEAAGGVTQRHADYVSTILLMCELMAVSDDTVDRTPTRSGRPSFPAHFGDGSALPFAASLVTMTLEASRAEPKVFAALADYYVEFYGLELWEREHLYPERPLFDAWLENRYGQTVVVTEFMLSSALLFHGRDRWPRAAVAALSRIEQDVDDLVNLVEYRAGDGENDDLQSGVVTRALIVAIAESPALAGEVRELWRRYEPIRAGEPSIGEMSARHARVGRETEALYARVRAGILRHGVPGTVAGILADYRAAVRATPLELRPFMRELAATFVRRLRRLRPVDLLSAASPSIEGM
jgi:hypothetical protein